MKALIIIVIGTVLVVFGLLHNFAQGKEMTYSSGPAIAYARMYCREYNTERYNCFDPKNSNCVNYNKGGGTDCANFMSHRRVGVRSCNDTFYLIWCFHGKATTNRICWGCLSYHFQG